MESNNLSVLNKTIRAYKLWLSFNQHVNKNLKFSLVSKIDNIFLDLIELIFQAATVEKSKKLPYIQKSLLKLDSLRLFLRILWETKAVDSKKYIAISISLDEIGKMLGGWQRNLLNQTSAQ